MHQRAAVGDSQFNCRTARLLQRCTRHATKALGFTATSRAARRLDGRRALRRGSRARRRWITTVMYVPAALSLNRNRA
jgi:hypothetical protein